MRASVRHARHLAETLTDQSVGGINHTSSRPIEHSGSDSENTPQVVQAVATRAVSAAPQALEAGTTEAARVAPGTLVGWAGFPRARGQRCGSAVPVDEAVTAVSVTNVERWGGSTEGIADSRIGGVSGLPRLSVVAARASAEPTAAAAEEAAEAIRTHAADAVVRIIRDTLTLCCEAPPLISRALEGLPKERETLDETGRQTPHQNTENLGDTFSSANPFGGKNTRCMTTPLCTRALAELTEDRGVRDKTGRNTPQQSTGNPVDTFSSTDPTGREGSLCKAPTMISRALAEGRERREVRGTGERTPHQITGNPIDTLSNVNSSGGGGVCLQSPLLVFTGVVEAVILAGSFRATTVCPSVSKAASSNDDSRGGHAGHFLVSSPPSMDAETAGRVKTPLPDPRISAAQHHAASAAVTSMVERQLNLLHQEVFPTPPAGGRDAEKRSTVKQPDQLCTSAAAAVAGDYFKSEIDREIPSGECFRIGISREEGQSGECFKSDVSKGEAPSREEGKAVTTGSESFRGGYRAGEKARLPDHSVEYDSTSRKKSINFALPFSWGSLPLIRVPLPACDKVNSSKTPQLRGKDARVAAVQGSGKSSVTHPSETARKV